jgi:hypothetical protein
MSSELACLDEIYGRCWAINVNFPDTGPRMASARQTIGRIKDIAVTRGLTEAEINELAEEITDLRGYLMYIVKEYPETSPEITPQIKAISYLLEPVSK